MRVKPRGSRQPVVFGLRLRLSAYHADRVGEAGAESNGAFDQTGFRSKCLGLILK